MTSVLKDSHRLMQSSLPGLLKPVSRAKFKANSSFLDLISLLSCLLVVPHFIWLEVASLT